MSREENSFQRLFKILINSLNEYSIPYVIVGGSVVPLYGNIRSTQDIDTMILLDDIDDITIRKWLKYLKSMNLSLDIDEITTALDLNIHSTIFDKESFVFRVDLKKISSQYDYLTFNTRREVDLFEIKVDISSPESLIGIKMSDGFQANTDLEDVLTIIETTNLELASLHQFLTLAGSKTNLCKLLHLQNTSSCVALSKGLSCHPSP